jgi:uncharacterized protein YndB with AHSA1/START domain
MTTANILRTTKLVKASRERVFAAWTKPELLKQWWGPGPVTCPEAHIDLWVGGSYRIANLQPDGIIVWISGTFEQISPPEKLVYDWNVSAIGGEATRVTVLFNEHTIGTEVVLIHERLPEGPVKDMHLDGWQKCLDKLEMLFA